MLGLIRICLGLAAPFAIVPFFIQPVFGFIVWLVLSLVFRFLISFRMMAFYREVFVLDKDAESSGLLQSLYLTRSLSLQDPQANLTIWVSKRTDVEVYFLAEKHAHRVLVIGQAFLSRLSENDLRVFVEKADQLTRKPQTATLTEVTRLIYVLTALRIRCFEFAHAPAFLLSLIVDIPLRQARTLQLRLARQFNNRGVEIKIIGETAGSNSIDALLAQPLMQTLLAHAV